MNADVSDSKSQKKENDPLIKLGKIAVYIFALAVLLICVCCDFSALFENSDYISCLYVGGKLFAQGRFAELYAPYGAVNFFHMPCDLAGHKMLANLAPAHISLFNYSPLVAFLLAPLSYLSPSWSLLVWQAISVCALVMAIKLLRGNKNIDMALSLSLLFLPTAVTLWIGQTDLILGVICFASGYRFLIDKKPLYAGLAFSLCSLKPQMIILPLILTVVLLFKKEWRYPLGFFLGCVSIVILNIAVGGPELFMQWLWNMRLCEKVFTDPTSSGIDLMRYLIISLPGVFFLTVFKNPLPWLKMIMYAVNVILICFTIISSLRFSKIKPEPYLYISYTVILGLILMTLIVPNFLYYDATILLIAGCICCDSEFQNKAKLPSYVFTTVLSALLFNIYGLLFLVNKSFASPIFPLLVSIFTFLQIAKTAWFKYDGGRVASESS